VCQPQEDRPVVEAQLRVETHGGASGDVIIRCIGEIDLGSVDDVQRAIDTSFAANLSMLRLDLSHVSFIDLSGVRCLMECERRCGERSLGFEVAASAAVNSIFSVLGLRPPGVEATL
jgi:anti-anti-sigma factor